MPSNGKSDPKCPACGATFQVADRRKKVQCPHCKEIVELGVPKAPPRPAPPEAAARELGDLRERLARLEALEVRIEALERKIAELNSGSVVPLAPFLAAPVSTAEPKLAWHVPISGKTILLPGEIPAEQRAVLVKNISELGPRRIVIQAAVGDPLAWELGERFREIFAESGWSAPPLRDAPAHLRRHSLALTAPANASPHEMAVLFMALAAAGLQVVSQIDPSLNERDPILSIGPYS